MKHTILSQFDAKMLEETIVRYGRIVTFDQLKQIFKSKYSVGETKNRVSALAKTGWLVRIKKGLYVIITDLGSLAVNDISLYVIAGALNRNSYISFENALQYHGMFDQMLTTVGAVTSERARKYIFKDAEIRFFKIKRKLYFGFVQERADIGLVNIACKEKVILDILYFRSNAYYAGLVWEKLKEYKSEFDFDLLKNYAGKFNLDVIRQIGFFLDRLGVDTGDLAKLIKGKSSYSRMTKDAGDFNSKWRIYFDRSLIR
ncbi:hypothetical protein KAU39_05850 [bacterium]|nr:hypothetical protein [bacterium]